jgi:hypothetical protein
MMLDVLLYISPYNKTFDWMMVYLVFAVAVALQEADEVLPVCVFDQHEFHASVVQMRKLVESLGGYLVSCGDTEQPHL